MFSRSQASGDGSELDLEKRYPTSLPGAVCRQYRRRGEKTFGPYYFRFWREDGRLRKEYVKVSELQIISAACQAARTRRKQIAAARRETRRAIGDVKALCRGALGYRLSDRDVLRLRALGIEI